MAKKYYIENIENYPAVIYIEEGTQPENYSLIIDEDKILNLVKQSYIYKEADGKEFYNSFRSRLAIGIINGTISNIEAFTVENYLSGIAKNLNTGNWLTAQYLCNNLEPFGIFTQDLKEEIYIGISLYIALNY